MPFGYRGVVAGLLLSVGLCACVPASGSNARDEVAGSSDKSAMVTATERPVRVQFRDLFTGLNPSDQAIDLSGSEIEIVGYLTPPQSFPFRVLVGLPSETCPYCEPPEDENDDVIPFLLVLGDLDEMNFSFRSRLRVKGVLQARRNAVGPDGRKLEMRLMEAVVEPDARYIDPRERTRDRIAMSAHAPTRGVEGSDN
ncbi:MAG: hypothetical protein AAFZ74_13305 [Pseudomonadota bacterium]